MLRNQILAILYHDIFYYPLTKSELSKWTVGKKVKVIRLPKVKVKEKDNFYFISESVSNIAKRISNERTSQKKLLIAKRAGNIIKKVPTVRFVGITGALAMNNADEDSDIDLLIVTYANNLWTTRLLVYIKLLFSDLKPRHPGQSDQKNKLCLNMWLDETDLEINKKHRNVYSAHELAQIIPLINKDKTYERLLLANKWIKDYWPNAVEIPTSKLEIRPKKSLNILEPVFFWLQYKYMKSKLTIEVITATRAFFHPVNWNQKLEAALDTKWSLKLK